MAFKLVVSTFREENELDHTSFYIVEDGVVDSAAFLALPDAALEFDMGGEWLHSDDATTRALAAFVHALPKGATEQRQEEWDIVKGEVLWIRLHA
jgi:hypothetical protein